MLAKGVVPGHFASISREVLRVADVPFAVQPHLLYVRILASVFRVLGDMFAVVSQHLLVRIYLLAILLCFLPVAFRQVQVILDGLWSFHLLSRGVTEMILF